MAHADTYVHMGRFFLTDGSVKSSCVRIARNETTVGATTAHAAKAVDNGLA